jgi:hypothetical protein
VVIFDCIPAVVNGHNAQGVYAVVLAALTISIDYNVSMMSF